jgi:hemerythrin-like domain-containing protein
VTCKCIEVLTAEHNVILRIADVLESISHQAQSRSNFEKRDVEEILQILHGFGDDFHQTKEESFLFPIFISCDASQHAAVQHMFLEHERDRSLMAGMQNAISRGNAAQIAEYSLRLANTLRNHVSKEDNILFETIAAQLNDEDDAKIVAAFEGFDREFEGQKVELLDSLRMLEWKYLRKVTKV